MKDFCQSTISRHLLGNEKLEDIAPLSTNEARRNYRFEIFCTISSQPSFRLQEKLDWMDMCSLFLNQFTVWEVEEIPYVRAGYIIGRYAQLFEEYEHELVVYSSAEVLPEEFSGGLHDIRSYIYRPLISFMTRLTTLLEEVLEHCQEHCMSQGLDSLRKISQAPGFDRVCLLRKNLIGTRSSLTQALQKEPYDFIHKTSGFHDWIGSGALPFVDDKYGPNAAWTWASGGMVELFPFLQSRENLGK